MKTQKNYFGLLLLSLIVLVNSYAQGSDKGLRQPIIIHVRDIRVDSLLQLFQRQTGLEFSFNSNKISSSNKVVVSKKNRTVAQWLTHLEKKFAIQYRFVGNHIILIDGNKTQNNTSPERVIKATKKTKIEFSKNNLSKSTSDKSPREKQNQRLEPNNLDEPVKKNAVKDSTYLKNDNVNEQPQITGPLDTSQTIRSPVQGNGSAAIPNNEKLVIDIAANVQPVITLAEQNPESSGEVFQVLIAYSKHGSGDMKGIVFGTEYLKILSPKFSLGLMLRGSINSDKHSIFYDNQITGQHIDASIRFTTAGVQLGPIAKFYITSSSKHGLSLGMGIFGRYQSASNGSDGYSIYMPQTTGVPSVLIGYQNLTPQHTISFGGLLQWGYSYSFSNKILIGIVAGFQTDTNGDTLPQVGLSFGKSF